MGHPPADRRFQDVDEIYIFRVSIRKLAAATAVASHASSTGIHARQARGHLAGDRGAPGSATADNLGAADLNLLMPNEQCWTQGKLGPGVRNVTLQIAGRDA